MRKLVTIIAIMFLTVRAYGADVEFVGEPKRWNPVDSSTVYTQEIIVSGKNISVIVRCGAGEIGVEPKRLDFIEPNKIPYGEEVFVKVCGKSSEPESEIKPEPKIYMPYADNTEVEGLGSDYIYGTYSSGWYKVHYSEKDSNVQFSKLDTGGPVMEAVFYAGINCKSRTIVMTQMLLSNKEGEGWSVGGPYGAYNADRIIEPMRKGLTGHLLVNNVCGPTKKRM